MELQIISLETAILLKENEFNWETDKVWLDSYSYPEGMSHIKAKLLWKDALDATQKVFPEYQFPAPTQELLRKWLRDIHDRHIYIIRASDKEGLGYSVSVKSAFNVSDYMFECFRTYEEALEIGLLNILRELKENKNDTTTG